MKLLSIVLAAAVFSCAAPANVVRASMAHAPEHIRNGVVGDLHVHVTMKEALPFFHGVPGSVLATNPDATLVNQVDAAALRAHGVRVVVATVWPPPAIRPGRRAMDEALAQLDGLHELTRRDSSFAVVTSAEEATAAVARGQVALLPALEGAEAIEAVEDVDALFAAGFRSIGLVHFTDNAIADAENGQFGALASPLFDGRGRGLTELGRAAVTRMFALGVVVDVAHCSPETVSDVLQLAEKAKAPIISSHAGSGMRMARTISDEHARRIHALGGLIGVGVYRHDLLVPVPAEDRFEGFVDGTCDEAISHWLHLQRVTAPDTVVLGSDLSSVIHRGRAGGRCKDGIRSAADLGAFFDALVRSGVPAESLGSSGARILRLFERVQRAATATPTVSPRSPARSLDEAAL